MRFWGVNDEHGGSFRKFRDEIDTKLSVECQQFTGNLWRQSAFADDGARAAHTPPRAPLTKAHSQGCATSRRQKKGRA